MFKELKLDFPALLALNVFLTFALVIVMGGFLKLVLDPSLVETLKAIVMLVVGFYFGSSAGSKTKDDSQNKIVEKLTATNPAGTPGPVAPVTTNGEVK